MVLRSLAALLVASAATTLGPGLASAQEHVLVPRDAHLYAAPSEDAERVRDPWGREHGGALGRFMAMRFVAERDGWVEVATSSGGRASDHCYAPIAALEGIDVRFFVRERDVAEVVARTVTKTLPGGGSITLVAGVGLTPRGRNQYDAHVPGATVRVSLDPSEVAQRYRPGDRIEIGRRVNALLASGARVVLGRGSTLVVERAPRTRRARSSVVDFTSDDAPEAAGPPRATFAVETDGSAGARVRATVRTECLEAVGQVSSRDLTTDRPPRPASELRRTGSAVRPGAALYWPDGSRAGTAAGRLSLTGRVTPRGPNLCFDHPLRPMARPSADDTLTLCVDRTAVSRGR